MQSVRALDSGPSTADSRRCACCPFGYHIDSSFVSFAHSVTAGGPANGSVVRPTIRRRARGGSVGAVADRRRMPPPPPPSASNLSGLHRPVGPSASTGGGSVQDLIDELEGSLGGSPLSPLSPPARKPTLDQEDTFATFGTTQRRLTVQQQQLQMDSLEHTSMSASSDFNDRWPLRRGRRPHSASGHRDNSPMSPPPRPPMPQQQQQKQNEHEQQEDILLQRLQRPVPTIQFATSGVSTSSHWESRAVASCEAAVRTPPTKATVSSAVARTDAATVTVVFGGVGSGVDFGQTVFSSEDGSLEEPVAVLAAPPRRSVQELTQPPAERLPAAMAMLPDIGWDEALLRRQHGEETAIAAAGEATEEQVTAARFEQLSESSGAAVADVSFAFMLPPERRDFSQQVCAADGKEAAMEELVVVAHAAGSLKSSAGQRRSHIDKKVKVELPIIQVLDDPRVDLFSDDEYESTTVVDERVEPQVVQQAQSAPNFAWMLPATATQTDSDNSVTRVVSFLSVAIGTERLDNDRTKLTQLADASVETDSVCKSHISMETEPVAKSDFAFTTSPVAQFNVAIETERQCYRDTAMETITQKFVSVSMETDSTKVISVSMATDAIRHSDVALETARLSQSSVSTETEAPAEPPIQHSTSSASTPPVFLVDATSECRPQLAAAAVQARPTCQDAAVDFAAPAVSFATSDAWQQADRQLEFAAGIDVCVGTETASASQEDEQRNRRRSGGGRRHAGVTARPACRDVSLNFCTAPPERRSVGVDAASGVQLVDATVSTTEIAEDVDEAAEAAEASLLNLTLVHRRQSVQTQIRQLRRSYGLGAGELAQLVGDLLRRDVKSVGAQARPDTVSASAATGSGLMVSRSVGGDDGDASVQQAGRSAEAGVQCRPAASNKFAFTERLHSFEAATNTNRLQLRDQFTSPERPLLVHSVACGPAWPPLTVATDGDAAAAGEDSPPTPPTPPQQRPILPPTFPELHPLPSRQPDLAGYARTQMVTKAGSADSPIRQFSAAEAAAASAAGALSPSSPRSILKRSRAAAAELGQEAKKGVRFHSGVVGGSPSSSSADDDDEEEDFAGSPIEGSYFGADGRIELLYEHEDDFASASASASSAFDEINEENRAISDRDRVSLSQPLMLQVPQDVEKACATFEAFRHDSTGVSAAELNDALSLIRRDWFRVSSVREASASQVKAYCDYFAGKSEHLLKKVINMADDNGNTSLHYSVSHGRWSVVRVLLATGLADADRSNLSGYSAAMLTGLSHLAEEDTDGRDTLRDLLGRSDVNRKATSAGQTALMLAASHGRLAILRLLLEAGADPNAQDDEGSTALMFAAEHGNLECARELLARPQTATELEDNEGSTALSIAMTSGHRDVALLIYARVNLSNKGEDRVLFGSTTL